MAHLIITKETKERLLLAISSGPPISALDLILTCWNREFQAELLQAAKQANNSHFFEGLNRLLARQEEHYTKPKQELKISPKYNPTGMGFQEFLESKGLYYYEQQFVKFVPGGAVESNRRRH